MDHDAREVTFRPGGAADLGAILAIQTASRTAAQWDPAEYLAYDLTVAERSGAVVGFIVTRSVASDEREILNVAVHPDFRRRQIGASLLQHVLAPVHAEWFLEVRASNRTAIDFYTSVGFKPAGIRRGYYSDAAEDAVVMRMGS